jgi:hypothetical protein
MQDTKTAGQREREPTLEELGVRAPVRCAVIMAGLMTPDEICLMQQFFGNCWRAVKRERKREEDRPSRSSRRSPGGYPLLLWFPVVALVHAIPAPL